MKRAKFEFIAVFSCQYSVSELCSALKVTRQGYYAYRKSAASEHALRGAELAAKILEVYEASRRIYGSPKAFRVLKRGGERVSRKRAAGTMRENGWRGVTRRCAKNPEGGKRASKSESAPDLVKRDFSADGPNEAWIADITYVRTHQGRLRLAAVMDVWSRRVVGRPMVPGMTAELADDALKMAIAQGPGEGLPPSFEPREPVRVAAHRRGHGRKRHRAVHGVGFEPVGQRRDGIPDGGHQGGMRPCARLLRQGRGRARDIRAHRALLRQDQDSLRAWLAQPRGVREKADGREPLEGGLVPVNEIGTDSSFHIAQH